MNDIKSVTQIYLSAFQPDKLGFTGAAWEHDPVPASVHVTFGQAGDSGPGQQQHQRAGGSSPSIYDTVTDLLWFPMSSLFFKDFFNSRYMYYNIFFGGGGGLGSGGSYIFKGCSRVLVSDVIGNCRISKIKDNFCSVRKLFQFPYLSGVDIVVNEF